MTPSYQTLFSTSYLRSIWSREFEEYLDRDGVVLIRLRHWAEREFQTEAVAEQSFISVFFNDLWDYWGAGQRLGDEGYSCYPKLPIQSAGQLGGTGTADLALGWFGRENKGILAIPQVLCEFKDIKSSLDKEQQRKGNNRSPVKQCFDYLTGASKSLWGNEPLRPTWGIVTDMNEFRLYHYKTGISQYQRFVISPLNKDTETGLLSDDEETMFLRFVFWKIFDRHMLLTTCGRSTLEELLKGQWNLERTIEKDFYKEYHTYREVVFKSIVEANPQFMGTRGKLVRLTQRFLDRCIFILFCDDMGTALAYPPNLLRDLLRKISCDEFYNPDDEVAWLRVKQLFIAMRDGSPFADKRVNRFNGGLFEEDPDLDNLKIPTHVFCFRGQGARDPTSYKKPDTLLYFSATYNFGLKANTQEKTIGLYTLGRIFEQSITDLEKMEARADERVSLMELSKRKSDGVYYTPEWVTHYIVQETVGQRLEDIKKGLGLDTIPDFSEKAILNYRRELNRLKGRRSDMSLPVFEYMHRLLQYTQALEDVKIVDPACGSGAFLIQALDCLMAEREWISRENLRITGTPGLFDMDSIMKDVLSKNIYGVDINPESVEITRLALWLRTALPDRPLASLDNNIQCGNSLIGPEFYTWHPQTILDLTNDQKERINVFDWKTAFPQIFNKGGFDCVVSNPPYVRLQFFREYQPEVADYLMHATKEDGSPLYESTQNQNFDMYLPFIEKGISLLNPMGRMGYIAPSVWMVNEYGRSLRKKLSRDRNLDRWLDFRDYQVFDEAMTYTAIQLFLGSPCRGIKVAFAPVGESDLSKIEWLDNKDLVSYKELPADHAWGLRPLSAESSLLEKLKAHRKLEECCRIIVGIQPTPDEVYLLRRLGTNRYVPYSDNQHEIQIEDDVMLQIVSGPDTKRYQSPENTGYALVPYRITNNRYQLWGPGELVKRFPDAWDYFMGHEQLLRRREGGVRFNDDRWYRLRRPSNLALQRQPKLCVAQTVPGMRVFFDAEGRYLLNNVRVNGILPECKSMGWFLLGCLNSPVVDFVFRRIARPKAGGYFEANKQFIAPLPIPKATHDQVIAIGEIAKDLQVFHTRRRDLTLGLERGLISSVTEQDQRPESWLWSDVHDEAYWRKHNPQGLQRRELTAWAKKEFVRRVNEHLIPLAVYLRRGAKMDARYDQGRLIFYIADFDQPIIETWEPEKTAKFIAVQWRYVARTTTIGDGFDARRLLRRLLSLRKSENEAFKEHMTQLDKEIQKVSDEIAHKEKEINETIYSLYGLTDEERRIIESEPYSA